MKQFENNAYFWQKVDTLLLSSSINVKCKKGTSHIKYPTMNYPLDFGYIGEDKNSDGSISFYLGSKSDECDTMIVAVDILSKEIDVKLLIGCSEQEEDEVIRFLNHTDFQKTIIVRRGDDIPAWSISD